MLSNCEGTTSQYYVMYGARSGTGSSKKVPRSWLWLHNAGTSTTLVTTWTFFILGACSRSSLIRHPIFTAGSAYSYHYRFLFWIRRFLILNACSRSILILFPFFFGFHLLLPVPVLVLTLAFSYSWCLCVFPVWFCSIYLYFSAGCANRYLFDSGSNLVSVSFCSVYFSAGFAYCQPGLKSQSFLGRNRLRKFSAGAGSGCWWVWCSWWCCF